MNVLINATSARLGGGLTTLRNLFRAFADTDGARHRYTVVARSDCRAFLDPGDPRVSFATSGESTSVVGRLVWEQLGVATRALIARADVLLSPASIGVVVSPVPQVLIFRNMAPFDPDVVAACTWQRQVRLKLLRAAGILTARSASSIVFVSEHARRATLPQLRVEGIRTDCIPLGRNPDFSPEARGPLPEALSRLGVRVPYVLAVGHFYRHKNFVELVHGFSRALGDLPRDVRLVIVGQEAVPRYAKEVRRAIARESLQDHVVLTGAVPYDRLPLLYANASLFVFPSCCESFPNTLIEAMACGAPTLSSRVGPMAEIAGEGANYFDPFDPDDIAAGILRLWHDRAFAERLASRGVDRVSRYTWAETARRLVQVLEEAAARS